MASLLNFAMRLSHGGDDFTGLPNSFYKLSARYLTAPEAAEPLSFETLRGRVVLVINVASA